MPQELTLSTQMVLPHETLVEVDFLVVEHGGGVNTGVGRPGQFG